MTTRIVTILMLIGLLQPVVGQAQPPNDSCVAPGIVAALPFSDTPDTTMATVDADDQSHGCTGAVDGNTVWYSYSPITDTTIDIDTAGSSFSAVIAVYDGACGPLLAESSCFLEPSGSQSRLAVPVAGGTTVFIQISDPALAGGSLVVKIDEAPYKISEPTLIVEAANSADLSTFGTGVGVIGRPTVLTPRKFAFGATDFGLFYEAGGVLTEIASTGDATPVGGTFVTFANPTMQNVGFGAFYATIEGLPGVNAGIFKFVGAAISAVAVVGDPAPSGGVFTVIGAPSMNLAGDLVFVANTSVAPINGIFELPLGGPLAARIVRGAVSPCGGTFNIFDAVDINIWGDLAFSSSSIGGSDGFFTEIGGVVGAIACEGDPDPSLGGTYDRVDGNIALNDVPWVVFRTEIDTGIATVDAVYAGPPAAVGVVAYEGLVAVTGETIDGIDRRIRPAINNNNQVAFHTDLTAPDRFGLAFVPPGAGPRIVAKRFDVCGAGSIKKLGDTVSMNNGGTVIVEASCGIGKGVIRVDPIVGLSKVAFHTDGTGIGNGFLFEPGEIDVAGNSLLVGARTTLIGVACNGPVCTPATVLASAGDPWPIGGRTVRSIFAETVGGVRRPVFTASVGGVVTTEAIAIVRGNGVRKIVESGDPTPGVGGTFASFADSDPFDPYGGIWRPAGFGSKVAFAAALNHPVYTRGVFIFRNGNIVTIAGDGEPSPDGGTYVDFSSPALSGSKVAFAAETTVGACVLYARRPTTVVKVACVGDAGAVATTTIDEILGPPTIERRNVVFAAAVSGGASSQCLFAWKGSGLKVLACDGDPRPNGGTFAGFQSPDTDNVTLHGSRGAAVFSTADLSSTLGLHSWRKSSVAALAIDGDAAPSGGTFDLDEHYAAASKRTVVFRSGIDGGAGNSAVFVATLP